MRLKMHLARSRSRAIAKLELVHEGLKEPLARLANKQDQTRGLL